MMDDSVYAMKGTNLFFDAMGIQKCQRNRYPMLFIDKVDVVVGETAHAVKNFSYNEWYFPVHFDDEPNVPAFVQIESLTQAFLMTFLSYPEYRGMKTAFIKLDNVSFKRKIEPGDTLDIFATLDSFRRGVAKGHVESNVNGEAACSIDVVIAIPDILKQYRPS